MEVENFGLTENLMIAAGVDAVHPDITTALAAAIASFCDVWEFRLGWRATARTGWL